MRKFLDDSGVHDALDYLHSCGDYRREVMRQKQMPNLMRHLLVAWHRFVEDTGEPVRPYADLLADVYVAKQVWKPRGKRICNKKFLRENTFGPREATYPGEPP